MVRKLGTMGLLVAALMLVMMVAGASALEGQTEQIINVGANIGPYAELTCVSTVDLGQFTGSAYEKRYADGECTMQANTSVNLSLEFAPLTHANGDQIGTAVEFGRPRNNFIGNVIEWLFASRRIAGPWATGFGTGGPPSGYLTYLLWNFGTSATRNNIQGQEEAQYLFRVHGKLGDIHDQPAGDYSTQLVFTVSAN